jgi:hypothetical protein
VVKCVYYNFYIIPGTNYSRCNVFIASTRSLRILHVVLKNHENEMGRTCGAYGRGERRAQGVGGKARGKEVIGETQTWMGG